MENGTQQDLHLLIDAGIRDQFSTAQDLVEILDALLSDIDMSIYRRKEVLAELGLENEPMTLLRYYLRDLSNSLQDLQKRTVGIIYRSP